MATAVVLSSASTTIHWFLLFSYFLSLFMSQSCLADDQYFKLHRGRLISRKLCPSCKLYPFFRDSPIVAARESIAWIPVRASVSAAAVMVLLCSFLWHTSRRNHLYEEELQENGQDQIGLLGSRESTTGNDNTDDTFKEGNQRVECPDLSLFPLHLIRKSCLADDQYFKLHRGRLVSRKLCPSCKLYPFFRDSPIVAARESIAWIPVRASVSAAAVMVLLCSFIWHMNRRNHLYEEELQENGQDQTGILGSRESTTGNDNTDDTFEEGNQQVECPDLSLFPLHLIRKVTKCFSIEKKIGNQIWELWCEAQSLDELMDPAVVQSCDRIELMRYIHIGLLCIQQDPIDRPTMSSIVVMLASDEINLPQPNSPAFDLRSPVRSTDTWDISISINELTLSMEFPR
ncbi:hypothetical protein EZV62_026403 [Acer yangbiense]|uniref:S-locus receptor kinase C-terminal domain-containing protein n=1 Tax=Acer yangbiense TaxID=1000413 RepID=A0A5C7GRH9_9ROSI|nr:hypothetical protein EZV62_026403 [Acer yangbiense]